MPEKCVSSVVARLSISRADADAMYALFGHYYLKVDRVTFDRDLEEKDWVLLLRDGSGDVRGFTTLKLFDVTVHGRPLRAIFNGNTIIDRDCWGDQELGRAWCRFMADLKLETSSVPLYWFLICSGYRTYLYLPFFFRDFYPRHDNKTPAFEAVLIDHLGRMKYPQEYADGVVRVREPRECLQSDLAVPPPHRVSNPHVKYFVDRNSGYLRGDELVCVTEFSLENTRRTAHDALANSAVLR